MVGKAVGGWGAEGVVGSVCPKEGVSEGGVELVYPRTGDEAVDVEVVGCEEWGVAELVSGHIGEVVVGDDGGQLRGAGVFVAGRDSWTECVQVYVRDAVGIDAQD